MIHPKTCLACNPTDHESHEMKNPLCGQHVLSQSIELKHKLKHLKRRIADELNMACNKLKSKKATCALRSTSQKTVKDYPATWKRKSVNQPFTTE